MRILGIDPGSRLTGYGCVDIVGNQLKLVGHGTLKLSSTSGKSTVPLEQRLLLLYQGLNEVIIKFKPQIIAVEKVFFAKNALSALKLGQARGVALVCGAIHLLEVVEYSPSEVKQAVVGHGTADKDQVAKMVQLLIGRQDFASSDASDGLALAICHAHTMATSRGQDPAYGKALQAASGRRSKKRLSMAESLGITPESVERKRRMDISSKG